MVREEKTKSQGKMKEIIIKPAVGLPPHFRTLEDDDGKRHIVVGIDAFSRYTTIALALPLLWGLL
jgi:hypothetical protein